MSHDSRKIETKKGVYQESPDIPLLSIWRHYKGEMYKVVGFVMIESSEELGVCYVNLKHPTYYPWMRPFSEWNQDLGSGEDRFTLVHLHSPSGED
jgi:hypothetical protein